MRKYITGLLFAVFATVAVVGCSAPGDDNTARSTYKGDLNPVAQQPHVNVDPRTPEQKYTDALSEAGMPPTSTAKAVTFGRLICQMYADGNSDTEVQNSVALIVSQSQNAGGRGSEVVEIATKYLCPEYH